MKKILTLFLVLAGYVCTASADNEQPDIYLRSNIYKTLENQYYGWDNDVEDLKFTCEGVNPENSNNVIYRYTINATDVNEDINFRLHISSWGATQLIPYQGNETEWDFSTSNSANYDINSWSGDFKNDTWINSSQPYKDKYFTIKHTTVKASQYKISLYRVTNDEAEEKGHIYMVVDVVSMPLTISNGIATFSSDRALNFSGTGISAYAITAAADGELTKSSALTTVPANTGLFVEGANGTYNIPVIETSSASSVGTNMLVAGNGATISQTDGDKTNFILTVNKADGTPADAPKFFKVNNAGNTVPAGKAYLQIPTATVGAREFFWFDDDVTAINAVTNNQKTDGQAYNLAGQRIAQPTKGLYIVNGKKYIVK